MRSERVRTDAFTAALTAGFRVVRKGNSTALRSHPESTGESAWPCTLVSR